MLWQNRYDTQRRLSLKQQDSGKFGLAGTQPRKKIALMWAAEYAVRGLFGVFARTIGLQRYHLADMDEIATISHPYYDNHLRGGEGHRQLGLGPEKIKLKLGKRVHHALYYPKHTYAGTAANLLAEITSLGEVDHNAM